MIGQFTAVYIKKDGCYVGYVEEITGVNTQGRTLAETKKNLKEALILILETNKRLAHKILRGKAALEEPISIAV